MGPRGPGHLAGDGGPECVTARSFRNLSGAWWSRAFRGALVRREVRELAEHHDDLKQAALEEGLSEAEAAARADSLLGEPAGLAELLAAAFGNPPGGAVILSSASACCRRWDTAWG